MDIEEKIKKIEEEIQKTPYNKATAHHIGKLKAKISRLREEALQRRTSSGKGRGFHIKKSGDSTVVLIGFPSVGKSTLLNELTNAESKVGEYQFTTLEIVPGVMEYRGAQIQIFDIPGIITGASRGRGRGREILSVARSADLIVIVLDVFNTEHMDIIMRELRDVGIRPDETPPDVTVKRRKLGGVKLSSTVELTHLDERIIRSVLNEYGIHNADVLIREDITVDQFIDVLEANRVYIPTLKVINKIDLVDESYLEEIRKRFPNALFISADKHLNIDKLKDEIFDRLGLIRIYMKPQGEKADYDEPLIVKEGSTVADVCQKLHRDFLRKFRHARVWGSSVKFDGQKVGLDHVLRDEDVLRIIIKK
ncbi:GTP-binding protein [Methanothermobacter wolfeii]|uniref:GTP-binding protein n=1 Tax=Methanothermobacter wolfeii TaxID=145261 RepID=A0ABU8TXD6_METWO|nr:GTP-binding protein [Methanothermobacter sp. THM-1]NLM02724.1 GTP-binding protein [Methanothermobacter wolfeii]QHN05749.1 TGS domain-containing protein [Methanothermobacter sp. THM-1]SCM55813.1 Ribosome-interacting GTPase [Methanothermobacter wolfeii]